jgi:hypothetical protein
MFFREPLYRGYSLFQAAFFMVILFSGNKKAALGKDR